ncbi:unnamed protein product [Prunus armeniaca]|uniref:Uncharacterized protein n=1 Tax=Prunus armeniaca TaxID=36596 RepID=A0A6J5WJX9_PRUAR|nr:unnamed protein product [Prunus armeniaca]CAB4300287.1 unnamed protein product [Prunus armeniaca]
MDPNHAPYLNLSATVITAKGYSGLRLAKPSISHGTRNPLLIPPAVFPPILLSAPFTISHKVTGIKETSFRLKALIGDALQEITICPCCEEACQWENLTGPGQLED